MGGELGGMAPGPGGETLPPPEEPTLAPENTKMSTNIILERLEIEEKSEIDFDKGEKILQSISQVLDKLSDDNI
jgi:hypothetical protein